VNILTTFSSPEAVDAWDAEFRWRDAHRLRDVTIDDTWHRVAAAAAATEAAPASAWTARFVEAFSRWRLLPEARILRSLGTGAPMPHLAEPGAVLNVASFVVSQPLYGARFDEEAFVATAALAVRLLDDVSRALGADPCPRRLRIGLIGLADALDALGLDYHAADGRQQAARIAAALAGGCLRGSIELAEERGSALAAGELGLHIERMRGRRMPDALIVRAERSGTRHAELTAIDSHAALARLANGVTDAIGPLQRGIDAGERSSEAEMRAHVQPWIDRPIHGIPAH
jgi:ribonucleoside-diphosphate reductase alpha chain